MLYSQNGDRIMGTDSVTSLHPVYLGSEILAGDDFHSATDFWPGQNLVRSTTGLDSADVKSGRVESSGWKSSPLVHVWVTYMPVAGPRVWNSLQAALMGLLQLRYEHDSSTIRLRFDYDSATTRYEMRTIRLRFEHIMRHLENASYVLSSNNEHVNSFPLL